MTEAGARPLATGWRRVTVLAVVGFGAAVVTHLAGVSPWMALPLAVVLYVLLVHWEAWRGIEQRRCLAYLDYTADMVELDAVMRARALSSYKARRGSR